MSPVEDLRARDPGAGVVALLGRMLRSEGDTRMKINAYTVVAALVLAGCGELEDEFETPMEAFDGPGGPGELAGMGAGPHSGSSPTLPVGSPAVTCPGARLIGLLDSPNASCNLGGTLPFNWDGYPMFSEGSPGLLALGAPVPGELGRYCVFEREAPPMDPQDYVEMFQAIELATTIELTEVAVDCMGEFPQADLNDAAVVEGMETAFDLNVDRVDDLMGTDWKRSNIDVTLLDTVPLGAANPVNKHGLQLAAVIDRIACPVYDPGCSGAIRNLLAMPRENWVDEPDWSRGGHHGTQGDIAMAVYQAVGEWEARLGSPSASDRLILNLSLGWDRDAQGAFNTGRAATMALISALEYARCKGALVFTAAGNNADEACPGSHTGPLAPAMFEEHPALDALACASEGYSGGGSGLPVFGTSSYTPLVYAVGAVDGLDQPLVNSRAGGQPRLVATGINGVNASSGFKALSGTSVASAVASATAALIWSYDETRTPDEVAELLHSTGWATGATADFSLAGTPAPMDVRRISVCAALDQACAGEPPFLCPQPGCAAEAPLSDAGLGDFSTQVDLVLATATVDAYTGAVTEVPICLPGPWTNLADPQPEVPVCPYCNIDIPPEDDSVDPDDVLSMSLHAEYATETILGVTLTTYDSARTATVHRFATEVIDSLNDGSSGVTTVTLDVPDATVASLEFTIESASGDVYSQANAITVNAR